MQKRFVALSLTVMLMASGCSRTGLWSLAQSESSSGWDTSRLDFVVQREEMERDFREADRLREEKERLAQADGQPSPGILSEVQPMDPAEMGDPSNRTKLIRMVSKPQISSSAHDQERAGVPIEFDSQPTSNAPKDTIDSIPPATVVSHPLQPLGSGVSNSSEDVVTIQQLPPMMLAQPLKRKHRPALLAPKAHQTNAPMAKTELGSFGEIQQVVWEEEVQQEESEQEEQGESNAKESIPEPDEFTNEDFYVAGWCQNEECQDQCNCGDKKIAARVDGQDPSVLPAQFQVEDGPQSDLPPRMDLKLKPLRETPLRVASADPPLPAPGQHSVKATPLPMLSDAVDSNASNPLKTVSANEGPEKVTHSDFRGAPEIESKSWQQHLTSAIEKIELQVDRTRNIEERRQLQGKLELLRLLPSELDEDQQQYLNALTDLLQTSTDSAPTDVYETGQTLVQLRDAIAYLESIASLKVVNANFCTKVTGFGQFVVTENQVFEAGQTVLIYCEIENHSSQSKKVGEQLLASTRLAGSCIVYDENQQVVQQEEFPVVEDLAQRRRRDFYMHIPFVVGDLPAGKYKYQLMIDDIGGGKSASLEPALEFEIR